MLEKEEICQNLNEYIELFFKILQQEVEFGRLRVKEVSSVGKLICYLNWYKSQNNDWPEEYKLSEGEYERIIHWLSIGLNMPEEILKVIRYDTVQYYRFSASDLNLFVAEIYISKATKSYETPKITTFMMKQYDLRKKE